MATSNVSNFLQVIGQGIKPNMFMVDINFPSGLTSPNADLGEGTSSTKVELVNLLCKSAALPGSNLGVIEVPFRGRTVKIAGDRTFDTWTATFFADKNMELRALFEKWANDLNRHADNTAPRFLPNGETNGYMASLYVTQLEKDGTPNGSAIRTYKLHHCFPTNVSQIDLAYDSNDQIAEFTVEWQYSYFTADVGAGGETSGGAAVKSTAADSTVV